MTHSSGLGGGVDELVAEDLPVFLGRGVLDDDLRVLVVELVDDELVRLVELEIVVGSNALLRGGSTEKELMLVDVRSLGQHLIVWRCG